MLESMRDGEPAGAERNARLDLLRALVVVGPVFFHSALIFDPYDDYYVKSTITTEAVTVLAALAVLWAMPLLFLIAGTGVLHSLRRRDRREHSGTRLSRLDTCGSFCCCWSSPCCCCRCSAGWSTASRAST
jgi:glucan biosynthesis protein C